MMNLACSTAQETARFPLGQTTNYIAGHVKEALKPHKDKNARFSG